jgi:uncharacterized protein (DUF433 family)
VYSRDARSGRHAGVSRGGDTIEELLREFPDLERDDLLACLEYARKTLGARSQHLALT